MSATCEGHGLQHLSRCSKQGSLRTVLGESERLSRYKMFQRGYARVAWSIGGCMRLSHDTAGDEAMHPRKRDVMLEKKPNNSSIFVACMLPAPVCGLPDLQLKSFHDCRSTSVPSAYGLHMITSI